MLLVAANKEHFYPSSADDEEYFSDFTGVEWEEYRHLVSLRGRTLWCTKGYYAPRRCEVHYHDGRVVDYWEYDEETFISMGEILHVMEDPSLSYTRASWRVRFETDTAYDAALTVHADWAGRWERFQDVPKPWRAFYESCSEQDLLDLVKALDRPSCENNMWTAFREEFLFSPHRTPDWTHKVRELLLLKPSTAWQGGAFGWIRKFGVERAWNLISNAPSIWDASDLANEIWEISEDNNLALKLPSNWARAQKYRRKLVQKYEGWDPDVVQDLPCLDLDFQVIEGVEVRALKTTKEMVDMGKQYNNCLKTQIRRALDGVLHIWEVIDSQTGEGAILGFEEKKGGWKSTDMLFRGVDDADVISPLLHQQRGVINDALNGFT
jgi:hypothetical protein